MVVFRRRSVMVGLFVVVATAAMVARHASSDDCVYGHACPEEAKDGRGCCPAPPADATAKQAEDARKAAEKKKAAKAAEDARKTVEKKKAAAKAAEDRKAVEEKEAAARAAEEKEAAARATEEDRKAAEKTAAATRPAEEDRRATEETKAKASAAEGDRTAVETTKSQPPADARKAEDAKAAAGARRLAASSAGGASPPGACPEDMVHVPGGTFSMGSEVASMGLPEHQVTLSGYCIDRTEVTVAAYARCARTGRCTAAGEPAKQGLDSQCNGTRADRQDHPVNCVDWFQAKAYCAFMNKRLPSEAEWEYAARGSDGRMYPWGNEPPSTNRLNACDVECRALGKRLGQEWPAMYKDSDGWAATAPVGSFPAGASPFGALDMAGNVWEWTADWFGWYQPGDSTNPPGAPSGSRRVERGGGWTNGGVREMRAATRDIDFPAHHDLQTGFRCAR